MSAVRKFRKSILFVCKAALLISLFAIMIYIWMTQYREATLFRRGNYLVMAFYGFILLMFTSLYGSTRIGVFRLGEIVYSFLISLTVCNILAYVQFCLIALGLLPMIWIILATALQMLTAVIGAYLINRLYFMLYPARDLVVIRPKGDQATAIIRKLQQKKEKYKVREVIGEDQPLNVIKEVIDRYSSVLFCDINPTVRRELFTYCSLTGKRIYIIPTAKDVLLRSSHNTQLFDTPAFYCKNSGPSTEQLILKRAMDVVISALALLAFSPVMFFIALAVKVCDGGPVLFIQKRLTLEGRPFRLYKFRSMVEEAEKDGVVRLSSEGDDRITPVGRVIRKVRLDELPQLFNIFLGDMSLVGPRPERPEIADQYRNLMPEFDLRLRMKAGLTGYAQIYGRYNTTPQDKLLLDLLYIENYSFLMDLKMLFMTIKVMFMPESTQGLEEGQRLPIEADADRVNFWEDGK